MESDDIEVEFQDLDEVSLKENPEILIADSVYLILKKNVAVSRASRMLWLLNHIGEIVTLPKLDEHWKWYASKNDIELVAVSPVEPKPPYWRPEINHQFKYKITNRTRAFFIAHRYKITICLDMSPSQATVDIQRGELLLDQMTFSFNHCLRKITQPFIIPASCIEVQPTIYVTIIAHTPFFTTPAQQVLIKGVKISTKNVEWVVITVEKQLQVLEEKISQVTALAHEQIEAQQMDDDRLVGTLFEEETGTVKPPNIPMVSPDASFINMLRYSMLALSLLPDISIGHIIVVTDGVVCMPDINILESLLQQLHYDSTVVSFLIVGSSYHPHCSFGYVAYRDILQFISRATLGAYADNFYEPSRVNLTPNFMRQDSLLLWTFKSRSHQKAYGNVVYTSAQEWGTTNPIFQGSKVPVLLHKKQADDKMNTSLLIILSRRLREGYTLDGVTYENNRLEISLSLPWKTHTYLLYTISTQWPSTQTLVNYQVSIRAPYESLHDTTCTMKKQLRSAYRQAVVERFWSAIGQLTSADSQMAQHFNSFVGSNVWFLLPESVRNGMSVFVMLPSVNSETGRPTFTPNDTAYPKFGSFWQPICLLENVNWRKWLHIHRLSVILHHDQPLPNHLHLVNSSGRFLMVQCRQAVAALYGMLSDWASFVLIDNHSYIKFITRTGDKTPTWFCIIRITSKLPCAVLNLGFITGTPGQIRNQVCEDLKRELRQLTYTVRANPALQDPEKSPTKQKENACCTILNKPLEKILIRYERLPIDLTTVVFPDGTQPTFDPYAHLSSTGSTRRHSHNQGNLSKAAPPHSNQAQAVPTTAALLTTLSRYLHHRRWVWGVSYPTNPQLSVAAVARILSTITKMRLKEGFSFAHCASGIINMVLEVEMQASPVVVETEEPQESSVHSYGRCIIQYVLFPPHNAVCRKSEQTHDLNSDSDDDITEELTAELQMVTEVWVEPQFGHVSLCPLERRYLQGHPYHKIADVIGEVDSQCISSLLTLEHLSLMCQQKQYKYKSNDGANESSSSYHKKDSIHKRRTGSSHLHHEDVYFFNNSSSKSRTYKEEGDVAFPLIEERIHEMPFAFNLLNILPKCRQAELLFSTFTEFRRPDSDMRSPNLLLLESMFAHMQRLHDQELLLRYTDSQSFLQLTLNREDGNSMKTPSIGVRWCHEDFITKEGELYYPLWRCFVKGISVTHVMLTFVPASVRDLHLLNVPMAASSDHSILTSDYSLFNYTQLRSPTSPRESCSGVADTEAFVLPIFIYDCPLAVLMNGFVNCNNIANIPPRSTNDVPENFHDIFEDHTYKDGQTDARKCTSKTVDGVSPPVREVNGEPPEDSEDKVCLKRHCRTLVSAHSNCFVACVFRSLHLKYSVHSIDVQAAVDLCESTVINVDITKYIKTICGHINNTSPDTVISSNLFSVCNDCRDLRYLHHMIKEKFKSTVKETFLPVPSNADFYYCSPIATLDKSIDNSESDTWSNSTSSDDETRPLDDVTYNSIPTRFHLNSTIDGDIFENNATPLFLHFNCTIKNHGSIPIRLLPTCLGEVLELLNNTLDKIKLSEVFVTLDIVCSTLPREIQTVIAESTDQGLRTTSFCSMSPLQRSVSSEISFQSEALQVAENVEPLAHLLPYQYRAITTLEEEIKWQLRDEIATALLDVEPVTNQTLQMVTQHIEMGAKKFSCQLDLVKLNFVYGPSESMGRFIQEFRKLPVPDYKLVKEGDLYYLSKDYPIISSLDKNCKTLKVAPNDGTLSRQNKQKRAEEIENKIIASEVRNLMIDILNEVELELNQLNVDMDDNDNDILTITPKTSSRNSSYNYDSDIDPNADHEWLLELDKRRNILPNFWMIMKVNEEAVTVYFHCRFLELQKKQVSGYLAVQRSVISAIKSLCKHVNQFLLLQSLHDTRTCDRLLESEEVLRDTWSSQTTTPILTRNASLARLKSVEDTSVPEPTEIRGQVAYLEASLKFMPGFFACSVVWETHFVLHPRLKTGNNARPGLSRGIQALRTVLNKFSVVNRSNMFVYRDSSSNVFYLRLHENVNATPGRNSLSNSGTDESGHGLVSRSPSIASLPLGVQKQNQGSTAGSVIDIRPRVRSFGEKESQEAAASGGTSNLPPDDTITLKVHGVTGAGRDVTNDLVQVLQNRLDDAILELLSLMLERNPMCKLTPDDVHFLQKPFRTPEDIIRLSVQPHTVPYLDTLQYYLQQNLLQFLHIPKYTDTAGHYHFRDYSETDQPTKRDTERNVFLYNQSAASGSRGIACIAVVFVQPPSKPIFTLSSNDDMDNFTFTEDEFPDIVASSPLRSDGNLTVASVEFRIWQKGRVNIETLGTRLKAAVTHATWDLITEKYLLNAPLCVPMSEKNLDEFNLSHNPDTALSNLIRTGKYSAFAQQTQSLDGVKKSPNLPKTLSETEIDSKTCFHELKRNVSISDHSLDYGETGVVHRTYAQVMNAWINFGVQIRTPSVARSSVKLTMDHPLETMIIELQRFMKVHMMDTNIKAFSEQEIKNEDGEPSSIYVPFDPRQFSSTCLIIGRNFDQWKASYEPTVSNLDMLEPKSNKVLQKFSPLCVDAELGTVFTRQRLLLIYLRSYEITFYTYNWSRDRLDKLLSHGENLGLWLSARISVFNSIISQKLGLFHNQPVARKVNTIGNPYMPNVTEPDFVARFPSIGSASQAANYRQNLGAQVIANMSVASIEAFRDTHMSIIGHKVIYSADPIVRSVQEMNVLRQYDRKFIDEQKKLYSMWQSRGATTQIFVEEHKIQLLRQQSRVIHYCQTPFLFLPNWRLESAATRDHSLIPAPTGDLSEGLIGPIQELNLQWHDEICGSFFEQYNHYLQTLGFIPIQIGGNSLSSNKMANKKSGSKMEGGGLPTSASTNDVTSGEKLNVCYLQKSMLGGILIFELFFSEPFFNAKLYTLECQRIRNKASRQSMNQFILSFLDECDKIKVLMHLHSFAYDFHLRCIHAYICEANIAEAKLCPGYHLTNFLDDFMKYYSKAPNYARNLVYAETISIDDLITPPKQLYDYLLSHEKHYDMNVFAMNGEIELSGFPGHDVVHNEYVLVQVSSSPSFSYKDSQDRQHTDDFDITLIVSYVEPPVDRETDTTLFLKYYIMLTSRREIYPKPEVERTLGKFRTVTSTASCSSDCYTKNRPKSPNTDSEINTSIAQEMVEENSTLTDNSVLSESQSTDTDKGDNLNLNDIFPDTLDAVSTSTPCSECGLNKYPEGSDRTVKHQHSHIEIRQEAVNYLGYYSSHEQLMQQLILNRAEMARGQIRNMVTRGMVHCRTHSLWNKLVSKPEMNQLTYLEFIELRDLTRLEKITEIEPRLAVIVSNQSITWFQQFSKILTAKYAEQHRFFVSADGNEQHVVVLHPRYSGAFMMLSMDIHAAQGELYAAYRQPAQQEPSDITEEDRKSLISDFINSICFHIWVGML